MDPPGDGRHHCRWDYGRRASFSIGHLLLRVSDHSVTEELERKELWIGLALTVGILAVASFLATRPAGALGPLDKPVAIGKTPMAGELNLDAHSLQRQVRTEGTVADLAEGYTLYARNGAFAETIDVLKSVEDIGGIQRTLIYAKGLYGGQRRALDSDRSCFRCLSGELAPPFWRLLATKRKPSAGTGRR